MWLLCYMVKKKWAMWKHLNNALDNVKPSQKIAYSVGRALHKSVGLISKMAALHKSIGLMRKTAVLHKSTYFVVVRAGLHRLRTVNNRKN